MDFTIYLICLGAGLVFTLVSALAGHLFGDADHGHVDGSGGHAEAGADASDMPGVSAFSPTIMAAFVTAFGGFGIIFHQIPATKNPWISAPLAVVCGLGLASGLVAVLRALFRKTQSSSEAKVGNLAGTTATIITPIPQDGVGEIAYVQGGTRYTAPARSVTGAAVASGRLVKIDRIVGSQYYVRPE